MGTNDRRMCTRKEYDFFECSSAFQKSIRRSEEHNALYFGCEIYLSGYRKYAWKRVMIIASEDIGLANRGLIAEILSLKEASDIINESEGHDSIIPFIHAVLLLVRSEKSRLVDNAKIWAMKQGDEFEIPDYAFDVHTRKGKQMGRGIEYFFEEGSKLIPEKRFGGEEFYEEFFEKYARAYDSKQVDERGFNQKNCDFKTVREKDKWQDEERQQSMW